MQSFANSNVAKDTADNRLSHMKKVLMFLLTLVYALGINGQTNTYGDDEEEKPALSVAVYGREIVVMGVESFLIFDLAGKDVTSKNGELNNGIYIVYANGVALKVAVKG